MTDSQELAASAEEVYSLLADPSRRPEWMTELKSVEGTGSRRRVEVGDRFEGVSSILFHDFIGVSEIKAAEPPVRLGEEVVIGARFTSVWELSEVGTSRTRLRHVLEVQFPGGPFSWLERLILRRRLQRMQRQSLVNLSAHCRQDPG